MSEFRFLVYDSQQSGTPRVFKTLAEAEAAANSACAYYRREIQIFEFVGAVLDRTVNRVEFVPARRA